MDDPLDRHQQEGLEDLPEDGQDLIGRQRLPLRGVAHEVALLAVLHNDLQLLLLLVEVVVVDLHQVGVRELLHEFDLQQRLLSLEGAHVDLLEGEELAGFVLGQEDLAEAALADRSHCCVGLH